VRVAAQLVRRANFELFNAREQATYEAMGRAHARAPKEAWKRMERELNPLGVLRADKQSKLLLQLHDTQGKIISTDKLKIVQHLITHRTGVFQVRSTLDPSCEHNINIALAQMHDINKEIVNSCPPTSLSDSATCKRISEDALHLTRKIDTRRGATRSISDIQSDTVKSSASDSIARIKTLKEKWKRQCDELEADICMDELKYVVENTQEVGVGVDGMQTAVLRKFEPDELEQLLRLLNKVWTSGACPDDWKLVRCLLHYKGKGSDAYCVANYRGLGISDGNCKLLSLIMTNRLEKFLETTSGLSQNQGGFRHKRGTPEQTFTLAETVRSQIQSKNVQLCFVDIERAYDSVLHPLLWKRCADVGIGGRFLSTLQAMYDGAVAQLEVDQQTVNPTVPIECGVLQGNPLSPLLFNIYFDPVIHALEAAGQARIDNGESPEMGIPLPRVQAQVQPQPDKPQFVPRRSAPGSVLAQADRLASLWFADDGALPATDTPVLQLQLDVINSALKASGFNLNVPKTKWMLVPTVTTTETQYNAAKQQLLKSPLRVDGTMIELVDEFDYLGTRIWWRWNWDKAWQRAQSVARQQLGLMKAANFTYKDWSPYTAFTFANGKIFCHFNTMAAVAGAGGSPSSAAWSKNEGIITETMRTLMRVRWVHQQALRCEFGIWDSRTRIDMLLLRFWAKLLSCPQDSTHFRALCLSFDTLTVEARQSPEKRFATKKNTHRQPWAQHLLAAATRFKIPLASVFAFSNSVVEAHARIGGVWFAIRNAVTLVVVAALRAHDALRLAVAEPGATGTDCVGFSERVSCWTLPTHVPLADLFKWSPELRAATFASLKKRGNQHRQAAVAAFMETESARPGAELRRYIRIKTSSFFEPYLHLRMFLARKLLLHRADAGKNEGAARRRPLKIRKGTRQVQTVLPRLEESRRACYLCSCIDGCEGVFWPETIEHALLMCSFNQERRAMVVASLEQFAVDPSTVAVTRDIGIPAFNDASCLFTIVLLCTNIPDQPILHQHQPNHPVHDPPHQAGAPGVGVRTRSQAAIHDQRMRLLAEARRNGPQFELSVDAARQAAAWVSCLLNDWTTRHRDCRSPDPNDSPGRRLAELIAIYHDNIFKARRAALQNNNEFINRLRDPIRVDV
jgi:hypothetical protein